MGRDRDRRNGRKKMNVVIESNMKEMDFCTVLFREIVKGILLTHL